MYNTLRLQFLLCVIGCYLEESMGLTNLKFSSNHVTTSEGAADRRFLIFFFQIWEEIVSPALINTVIRFFFEF